MFAMHAHRICGRSRNVAGKRQNPFVAGKLTTVNTLLETTASALYALILPLSNNPDTRCEARHDWLSALPCGIEAHRLHGIHCATSDRETDSIKPSACQRDNARSTAA